MFDSLSLVWLGLIFAAAAGAVWVAGSYLSDATDVLSARFELGEAVGGAVLLAVATNLPEVAITATASWQGHLEIAVGNILGGIAIQAVVLALLDGVGRREGEGRRAGRPLTARAGSLALVVEGLTVVAVLAVAVLGTQVPRSVVVARLTPQAVLIVVVWVAGVWLVGRARRGLPWRAVGGDAGDSASHGTAKAKKEQGARASGRSTGREVAVFAVASAVTLVAGALLEMTGDAAAGKLGMTGALFAATVLAASTSLPEVSTGLASVRLGDDRLAVSDILGGNGFLPVLFLPATLLSGAAVLPLAGPADVYLAGLGALVTVPYLVGLIFRPTRRVMGVGVDSLVVVVLYALGMAGLFAVSRGG